MNKALTVFNVILLVSVCDNAQAESPAAAFNIEKIPLTKKNIGTFPFFAPPKDYFYGHGRKRGMYPYHGGEINEGGDIQESGRYSFAVDKKSLVPVEGKVFRAELLVKTKHYRTCRGCAGTPGSPRNMLNIRRSYEKAIIAAGGRKVFDGIVSAEAYRARDDEEKKYDLDGMYMTGLQRTYVIHKPAAEVWIEISCSDYGRCFNVTVQKGEIM